MNSPKNWRWTGASRFARTAVGFLALLWMAHAIGYLVHEYAHSFMAWGLGDKANPLALDYGNLNWKNVIFLDDIDENVDYDLIFKAGHGSQAAIIAVAGVLFGNGLGFLASRQLYRRYRNSGQRMLLLFLFLFWTMNVGNFISYVPCRTFTTHADMFTVQKGLNISPWWIVIVLGIPFCIAMGHFIAKITPDAMRALSPGNMAGQIFLALLTTYIVFRFFGSAGLNRYGNVSHWISFAFMNILAPAALFVCWPGRSSPERSMTAAG